MTQQPPPHDPSPPPKDRRPRKDLRRADSQPSAAPADRPSTGSARKRRRRRGNGSGGSNQTDTASRTTPQRDDAPNDTRAATPANQRSRPEGRTAPSSRSRSERPGLHARLADCTIHDRARLRSKIDRLRRRGQGGHATEGIEHEIQRAADRRAARAANVPTVSYPPELPVSRRRELIAAAIRDHQVTVVCGETGSGKTTQLPKVCLDIGRGVDGMIGHTQPRRLAARSVAGRIAKELGVPLGKRSPVGYQVRFDDRTDDTTLVKLMTDGVLLSETQSDPRLLKYDTIIIDEAHERSLNIDFLLGYLAQLLPKRPDLKLVITSATINPRRFAEHFAQFTTVSREPPSVTEHELRRLLTNNAEDAATRSGLALITPSGDAIGASAMFDDAATDESNHTHSDDDADDPTTSNERATTDIDAIVNAWAGGALPDPEAAANANAATPRSRSRPNALRDPSPDVFRPESVAPVVLVSGRAFPVEVQYLSPDAELHDEDERDVTAGVLAALEDIISREHHGAVDTRTAGGDVLVFLAGEREIRETAKAIRNASPADAEVLPLYARLAAQDQDRIFASSKRRKIILSTNIAETSLTVPGVTYVVDPGQARVSRYAARSRVQRLPIEAVSRASADQRTGRCGRVAPGVCYRLYTEDDYESRPPFTDPEILRTNLAGVILQMRALKLGSIASFPFINPPKQAMVREGEQTLHELGALDDAGTITHLGRQLARLPLDPRLGRMILAASGEACLAEMLVITSALSIQDPRERPADKRDAADRAHERFTHEGSDFLTYLNLWKWFGKQQKALGSSRLKKACQSQFLSYVRMREWLETHRQLREIAKEAGMHPNAKPTNDPDVIHRALLTGLLTSVGFREGKFEYQAPGGSSFHLWPGSALFDERPKWVMAAEIIETDPPKRYARTVAPIDPAWIEQLGGHLVTRAHSDPKFHARKGKVMASERVALHGLTVIPHRQVHYGPIDPRTARELFIYHGLVLEEWDTRGRFLNHNREQIERIEALEAKKRKRDVLVEHHVRYDFYDRRLPEDVYTGETFERWRARIERKKPELLFMRDSDLMSRDADDITAERFPDRLPVGDAPMPLSYKLDPGSPDDGVTVTVPVEALGQLDEHRTTWLVPGMLTDKIVALMRTLPKDHRRALGPASDVAKRAAREIEHDRERKPFVDAVADALTKLTGVGVPRELWRPDQLPDQFRMNIRVIDDRGEPIAESRDLPRLKRELRSRMRASFETLSDDRWTRDGITDWDFGQLPEQVQLRRGDVDVNVFPALVDDARSVKLRLFETKAAADRAHRRGLRRLFDLRASEELRSHAAYMPGFDEIALHYAPLGSPEELRGHLRLMLADRLFVGTGGAVRTQRDFDARLDAGWHRIGEVAHGVCDLALEVLKWRTAVSRLVDEPPRHVSPHAIDDLRAQLTHLTTPGFLSSTPIEQLRHYPRYLKAMELRIDRAGRDRGKRDDELMARVLPHWRQYMQVLAQRPDAREASAEFDELGWMIEEFRVQLFAQELRTATPVSDKRLREQWPKCKL